MFGFLFAFVALVIVGETVDDVVAYHNEPEPYEYISDEEMASLMEVLEPLELTTYVLPEDITVQ